MRTTPRPSYGRRALVTAALAGALAFGSVVGAGYVISGGQTHNTSGNENQVSFTVPAGGWAEGAEQAWSTTIDANASIFTTPDYLFAVSPGSSANATLTAYRLGNSTPTRLWSTTVDTSTDGSQHPSFLPWGTTTLVHGTTLYDTATGETSEAPWTSQHSVLMAGDTAIACDTSDSCSGYAEGSTTAAWSAIIPDSSRGLPNVDSLDTTVFVRPTGRFAVVGFHSAVNLDTGEVITVTVPMSNVAGWAVTSTIDGWAVRAVSSSNEVMLYSYGPQGGDPIDSYTENPTMADVSRPIYDYARVRSNADFKTLWEQGEYIGVLGVATEDSNTCLTSVQVLEHGTIELPTSLGGQGSPCFASARMSSDSAVLTVGVKETVDVSTFNVMYNAATGEQISFPGLDPTAGAVFDQATPTSVVGYDPATGTLTGYRPA